MVSAKNQLSVRSQPSAWIAAVLSGFVAPAAITVMFANAAEPPPFAPLLAIGLMGSGMLSAAIVGRLWVGIGAALLTGVALTLIASITAKLEPLHPAQLAGAFLFASLSFAARGVLFKTSSGAKGWWIALAIVAGEGAILATAWAEPSAIPAWLLVLLPAQWAALAIEASITGEGIQVAHAALIALIGTAAATLVVVKLWPRRWTYAIMFTTWLALSALVWNAGFGAAG